MKPSILRSVRSALAHGSSYTPRRGYSGDSVPSLKDTLLRALNGIDEDSGDSVPSRPSRKVTILGASTILGGYLSALLMHDSPVSQLALYDLEGARAGARRYRHRRRTEVVGYDGADNLGKALEGSDVVIIAAGVFRKRRMTRDDVFNINAGIVRDLSKAIAEFCPNALVNVMSRPVNSTVPIAAEIFKKAGTFDEKKLFGGTMSDVVRAETETLLVVKDKYDNASVFGAPVAVNVPVVGGHEGITILPLFSQVSYIFSYTPFVCSTIQAIPLGLNLSNEDVLRLTKRTQNQETDPLEPLMKECMESISSVAKGGALFAKACLKGLNGHPDVTTYAFVQSTVTELPFFTSKVRLGKNGVEEVFGLGPLNDFEQEGLQKLIPELKASIEKGIKFAKENN